MLLRFEDLKEVQISMMIFWVVTSCGLICIYQSFGRILLPQTSALYVQYASKYTTNQNVQQSSLQKTIYVNNN